MRVFLLLQLARRWPLLSPSLLFLRTPIPRRFFGRQTFFLFRLRTWRQFLVSHVIPFLLLRSKVTRLQLRAHVIGEHLFPSCQPPWSMLVTPRLLFLSSLRLPFLLFFHRRFHSAFSLPCFCPPTVTSRPAAVSDNREPSWTSVLRPSPRYFLSSFFRFSFSGDSRYRWQLHASLRRRFPFRLV